MTNSEENGNANPADGMEDAINEIFKKNFVREEMCEVTWSIKFYPGQSVRLVLDPDIEAIVTATTMHDDGNCSYEVAWIYEGCPYIKTMGSSEILAVRALEDE